MTPTPIAFQMRLAGLVRERRTPKLEPAARTTPEDEMVTITVNGTPREVDVPDDTPLLWVLRDTLAMNGTKFGCGMGQCGACTVHVDGRAAQSCQLPVSTLDGADITTIEGLSRDGSHPVQRAWVAEQVPQCGYCQSGQIMAAASLLSVRPEPSDDDIDALMNTNICRCGTYSAIRRAIHLAAEIQSGVSTDGDGGGR